MKELKSQDIEIYLAELGEELAKSFHTPVRVMIIGGAYMLLTYGNRETTKDVDVFPLNIADSSQPSRKTKKLQAAVRAVGQRNQLYKYWFNDVAFTMLEGIGPEPPLRLWKSWGMLEVYMPPQDFVFALKLFANRARDLPDLDVLIEDLHVITRQQAQDIANKYIYERWQKEYRLADTLYDLFGE